MSSREVKRSLVIGIGNPLRSDDGAGALIVEKIKEKQIPNVETIILQQLNIELLEDVIHFEKVLIIDASFLGEGMIFEKVQVSGVEHSSSTHHLSPELFVTLAQKLYRVDLKLYLCSIRGRNFDMGSQLSSDVQLLIPKAVEKVYTFLKEE